MNSRLFVSENPLFTGEYHQALKNSFVMADFGYTEGYKKTSSTKQKGEKSHFFGKYSKSFIGKNNSDNNLNISIQDTSNDKYLKLYKIKSNLVNYNNDVLENSMNFTYQKDDIFLDLKQVSLKQLKIPTKINMSIFYQKYLLIKTYLTMKN